MATTTTYSRRVESEVEVRVDPVVADLLFSRVDSGTELGREWLGAYYPAVNTPDKLIDHIAANHVYAGLDSDISRWDGFVDLPEDSVTVRIVSADVI